MLNLLQVITSELQLNPAFVQNALDLRSEGGTIPFIARYRKERTGGLDEVQLRDIFERHDYLTELEERKQTILKSIEEQGKLTEDLKSRISACMQKTELEDLYLPYKPKKRTRATIAKEKGLEPLAVFIKALNQADMKPMISLADEAAKFVSEEKGVKSAEEAMQGASDILAEEVSEKAEIRARLREILMETGFFTSKIKDEHPEGTTKFEMYRNYRAKAKEIPSHNMLALRRGETEGVLVLDFEFDTELVQNTIEKFEIKTNASELIQYLKTMLKDAFDRLMKTTLIGEMRYEKKKEADTAAVKTFAENLRELLLSSPAGMKPTLAIDPGFRTGCKVAALSNTGKFLEYKTVFPHQSNTERLQAAASLKQLIEKYAIELIAIGNGTAGRETDAFVSEVLQLIESEGKAKPIKVMVNESGASIYSAGDVAREEFPELDLTVRGAISIGRRLQDPLAELVKIDPKSIGVGQYQHDVDQKLLKTKLDETVESCVNFVGVDLNTASKELLTYVSGLNSTTAKNIVTYRNEKGAFKSRKELLEVPKFGPKAFEQAAGFLRIRDGENPLDNTAVHPESYNVVESIVKELGISLTEITKVPEKIRSVDLKKFMSENVGEFTLKDIVAELEKPGRDPRAEFKYAEFKEGVSEIKDLKPGMELEGVVTNVADFGAFVDIGVHQDGLIHISQLADRFVKDAREVIKVGQIVKVYVLEVNESLKRISLSRRNPLLAQQKPVQKSEQKSSGRQQDSRSKDHRNGSGKNNAGKNHSPAPTFSIEDLKSKFNSR
ncbi:MAG: Tex family protein [Chloroherpetonaceae bacterium]|nr:Tex family protein [Chloroherpetonaceae bacterium]